MLNMNLSESDTKFAKEHLHKWCVRERREHQESQIWDYFMKRPKFNFESRGWPDLAEDLQLPKPR